MHISVRAFAPRLVHRRALTPPALVAIDGAPSALLLETEAGVESEAGAWSRIDG